MESPPSCRLAPGTKPWGLASIASGFITPWIDGNGQTVYFDDLRYTAALPTTAAFATTPTTGAAPLNVTFTDQSSAKTPITDWTWDFGDGAPPSHEQNPIHTYNSNGVYTVTLTIATATDSNTLQKHWFINVGNALPISTITALTTIPLLIIALGYRKKRHKTCP